MTDDDLPPGDRTGDATEPRDDVDGETTTAEDGAMIETDRTDAEDESPANERDTPTTELLTGSRRIEGRVRWKWGVGALFTAAVVGVVVGAISVLVLEWGALPGLGASAIVAVLGVGHVLLLYRSWRYEVREDALYLERGVVTHVKTVVPFVRVQHIDTNRGPVDRLIGLSSLVVYTAGSRGADVTIPGLTPEDAANLQDRLKELAKESTGDDAV